MINNRLNFIPPSVTYDFDVWLVGLSIVFYLGAIALISIKK